MHKTSGKSEKTGKNCKRNVGKTLDKGGKMEETLENGRVRREKARKYQKTEENVGKKIKTGKTKEQ